MVAVARHLVPGVSFRREREDGYPVGPSLSRRELQVLAELSKGATNQEIATRLGISVHTVKSHVKVILLKVDARNRTVAAIWWERFCNHTKAPTKDGMPG